MTLRNSWMNLIRKADSITSNYSRLCSYHFKDGLKENNPSIFAWNENKIINFFSPEKRKSQKVIFIGIYHIYNYYKLYLCNYVLYMNTSWKMEKNHGAFQISCRTELTVNHLITECLQFTHERRNQHIRRSTRTDTDTITQILKGTPFLILLHSLVLFKRTLHLHVFFPSCIHTNNKFSFSGINFMLLALIIE